jgi:hypothetical protein
MYIADRPNNSPEFRYIAIKILAADLHSDKYDGDRLWEPRESSPDMKDWSNSGRSCWRCHLLNEEDELLSN